MSSASSSTAGSNAANQSGGQQAGGAGGSASGAENGAGSNGASREGSMMEKQPGPDGGGGAGHGHAGGTAEPPTSSSSATPHPRGPAASGTTGSSMATVLRRKTNVCLICGIYTNLSLNIFEPRNGPNIVDVIYEKYKFRAERGENADKHICFSCNNWLINWYSLQSNSSSSSSNRTYEPAPSTSRSSSATADSSNNRSRGRQHQGHKPRTKGTHVSAPRANDKENCPTRAAPPGRRAEQNDQVSSTTTAPIPVRGEEDSGRYGPGQTRRLNQHPYGKLARRATSIFRRVALRESNGHGPQMQQQRRPDANKRTGRSVKDECVNVVSSSTEDQLEQLQQQAFDPYTVLVKPFESRLIRMLEGQGTSVTKERVVAHREDGKDGGDETNSGPRPGARWKPSASGTGGQKPNRKGQRDAYRRERTDAETGEPILVEDEGNEIVLSFDSALSEVIDAVPSLKAIQPWRSNDAARSTPGDDGDPVGPLRQQLSSGTLSMSIIHVGEGQPNCIDW